MELFLFSTPAERFDVNSGVFEHLPVFLFFHTEVVECTGLSYLPGFLAVNEIINKPEKPVGARAFGYCPRHQPVRPGRGFTPRTDRNATDTRLPINRVFSEVTIALHFVKFPFKHSMRFRLFSKRYCPRTTVDRAFSANFAEMADIQIDRVID
jgi:hypothetical protein